MKSSLMPLCLLTLGAVAFSAGCAQPAAQIENPTTLAVADRDFLRRGITDVLRDMFFDVEQPARSEERIDTLPLVSAYPFEFWRPDAPTARDQAESALHTVRRAVTVTFKPAEMSGATSGPARTLVEVQVRKERLDLPKDVRAATVSESYSVFAGRVDALAKYEEQWGAGERWIDQGRDEALEQRILSGIRAKF